MLKNITFSARAELIQKAREKAQKNKTTLNNEFREWLSRFVQSEARTVDFDSFMERLRYVEPGRKFTREEMNER